MPENKPPDAITAISVKGFKSFDEETRLEIRPLTLLAGANSSGKSSALQPVLLLKQTLEASYDPGPLLLHDSHVKFTSAAQLLHKRAGRRPVDQFRVGIQTRAGLCLADTFRRKSNEAFDLLEMKVFGVNLIGLEHKKIELSLRLGMTSEDLAFLRRQPGEVLDLQRIRCFFEVFYRAGPLLPLSLSGVISNFSEVPTQPFNFHLRRILHVPGLRGNPTRAYRTTAVGGYFIGTFESYVASVIASWQEEKDDRIEELGRTMERIGLSWKVRAKALDATQVELLVSRLPRSRRGGASDLVNVADVGFGVSQTLPIVVALLIAKPGQLVYLEQPETHLHPRAQEAMAAVLVDAANRGVQVVAETHSSILLLAVQALVAEGKLDPANVILHWFQRGADGVTKVESAGLDAQGAYGDWPEDFGEVRAQVENRYLDAVESRVFPLKSAKKNAKRR